jgi:BMFP domain-containing protein YqiC
MTEKQALIERITALEARIAELERCKHEDHTISAEAVSSIAQMVMNTIASKLQPAQVEG